MTDRPRYTGRMTRAADGTISGYLIDAWQWRIEFTAEKDADGYTLTGELGPVPDALRLAAVDGEGGG